MPFLLLVCGLLGGALVSALVISTTLEAGSFKITQLQQQDSQLDQQRQQLTDQVANENSSTVIAQRAYELGMRPQGVLRFLDLKAARIETDANTAAAGYGAVNAINAPGYVP
ncbi:MAG: ftsL1 [Actinomycetia bacterium]|nr:ftsL1 [Actinomycetes bacterium]